MNLEVIKLREVIMPNGNKGTIMDIEDLKRLISSYNMNLDKFRLWGFSRGLWDNTLGYYNLTSHDLFSWRKLIIPHIRLHLNSSHGFSKVISDKEDFNQAGDNTKIDEYLKNLSKLSPNIREIWYSKITHNPGSLSEDLLNISRDLIELRDIIKKLHNRCRKYAIKNGVEYSRRITSSLENNVAKILDDLQIKYKPQFFIRPYHYDFFIKPNVLLEVDGGLHNKRYDKNKEDLAINKGYNLLRIEIENIKKKNYDIIKNKIHNLLGLSDSI